MTFTIKFKLSYVIKQHVLVCPPRIVDISFCWTLTDDIKPAVEKIEVMNMFS